MQDCLLQLLNKLLHFICSGNELELVLFDECSGDVYYEQLKNMESPVVALVNLARIAFDEEGCYTISNFVSK